MAELQAQIQADIAGPGLASEADSEFATQQQQILNEENAGAYIEEVSEESKELWKRYEADPFKLAVTWIYGTSSSEPESRSHYKLIFHPESLILTEADPFPRLSPVKHAANYFFRLYT